jgi:hypothetical protein
VQARRDVTPLLPSFDVCADTSAGGGISVVIFEAMAALLRRWASAAARCAHDGTSARKQIERPVMADMTPGRRARLYREVIGQGGI